MLARIFTRLFYAAVFFLLGVWAAPSIGGFGSLVDTGMTSGFARLWAWAESTVSDVPAGWSAAPRPAAEPPAAPAAPISAPPPAAAVPPPAPAPVAVATPAPAAPTTVDLLATARAAHARGDVTAAIRAYDDLIARRPNDVALRGELGNVYWAAGRLQEAARAYHAAALVTVAAGRLDEAAPLEAVIRKGDAALADDLARRIADARRTR